MMRTWWKELRLATRALARRPGFTGVATFTLALGIGAAVAIFTVVNAVLLRPLPYPDSEALVSVRHHAPGLDLPELTNSPGTVRLYRTQSRSFSGFAVFGTESRNLLVGDRADRVRVTAASPELLDVLRVRPALGRPFTHEDAAEGAHPVAILTWPAWTSRFGADPAILGRSIEMDGQTVEVIGVMPEGFAFPTPEPIALVPTYVDPDGRFGEFGLNALARLEPGIGVEAARQELTDLQARIPELFPDIDAAFLEQAGWNASVERYQDRIVGDVRSALWIVLGTVGFLLLIACANVANLFLVRAEARHKELAVRAALGAGRVRLAGGYLSESLLLGLAGGVLGMGLAALGVSALVASGPAELPRLHEVRLDGTVIVFGAALSLLAGLAFGALPILRYLSGSFARVLRDGSRGTTVGRERHRTRNALVTVQLALALVLLMGSGLMLRSFAQLRAVDPGIEPEGVLTVALSTGDARDNATRAAFYQQVVEGVAALPGVTSAGAATSLPVLPENTNGSSFDIESRPRDDSDLPPVAMYDWVAPGYFETMGIPLISGRSVERADHEGGRPVLWVSESFATTFLDGSALGERVRFNDHEPWQEIVGVVGDVRNFGLKEDIRPVAYLPMVVEGVSREELARMIVVARTEGDPAALAPSVRRVVTGIDPRVPLTDTRTMKEVVSASMADTAFTMTLLGIAAGVALLLGAVGIYGVIAYVVSQRTREIGVRMALGARSGDVQGMVVRQGLRVTVLGVGLGMIGAFALTRVMATLLFGVSATDPVTFGLVPLVLAGVALLASYLPARRASHIDPTEALRAE
jgi:predicted permease